MSGSSTPASWSLVVEYPGCPVTLDAGKGAALDGAASWAIVDVGAAWRAALPAGTRAVGASARATPTPVPNTVG